LPETHSTMGRNNSERYQHAILEETIAPSVNDANADTKVILDLLRFLATDANSPDIGRIDRHALAAFLRKPTLSIPEQWQPLW
ncbi:hypothetical protein PMAYCL1PPCAC_32973, partial [Pristionchus mayeri]